MNKKELIQNEIDRVNQVNIPPSEEINAFLKTKGDTLLSTGVKLSELIKRPELSYQELYFIDKDRPYLPDDVKDEVNIQIKRFVFL